MVRKKRETTKVKTNTGEENCWKFQEKCFEEAEENQFGFIYCISNKIDGKVYIGKKQFTFRKKKVLSKKARIGTRKRVEVSRVSSNWQNYWGSSKSLLEDIAKLGKHNFERTILKFCKNKSELSYWEVYYQIQYEVLFKPSYNGWISCKIMKNRL